MGNIYEYQTIKNTNISTINKLALEGWRVINYQETSTSTCNVFMERLIPVKDARYDDLDFSILDSKEVKEAFEAWGLKSEAEGISNINHNDDEDSYFPKLEDLPSITEFFNHKYANELTQKTVINWCTEYFDKATERQRQICANLIDNYCIENNRRLIGYLALNAPKP